MGVSFPQQRRSQAPGEYADRRCWARVQERDQAQAWDVFIDGMGGGRTQWTRDEG